MSASCFAASVSPSRQIALVLPLRSLLGHTDLLIHRSRSATLSLSILSAAASSCPLRLWSRLPLCPLSAKLYQCALLLSAHVTNSSFYAPAPSYVLPNGRGSVMGEASIAVRSL